jgi:putative redox protein
MNDDWREITTEWVGKDTNELTFIGHNAAGGSVQMGVLDGKPGVGPMELVLVAVAGCTGMDIVNILEKKRQPLEKLAVKVRGLRADTHPKIYTDIDIDYHVWGNVDVKALEQAIQLSEEKYCSVSAMLHGAAKITTQYHLYTSESQEISSI